MGKLSAKERAKAAQARTNSARRRSCSAEVDNASKREVKDTDSPRRPPTGEPPKPSGTAARALFKPFIEAKVGLHE